MKGADSLGKAKVSKKVGFQIDNDDPNLSANMPGQVNEDLKAAN